MSITFISLILLASVAIYSFGYGHERGRLSERRRLRLDPPRPTAKSGRDNQALREHITQLEHEVEELKEQLLERVSLHDQASRRFFKERLRAGDLEKRLAAAQDEGALKVDVTITSRNSFEAVAQDIADAWQGRR